MLLLHCLSGPYNTRPRKGQPVFSIHPLAHHIAPRARLAAGADPPFPFLRVLQAEGGSDYLGLRLDSRGISIPVLTVCLAGDSRFSEQQVERIEAMSSLLSLLFHAYESERSKRLALLDALTELPNRRRYDSHLKAAIG